MLGLRNPETFTLESGPDTERPWIKARYRDPNAAIWLELDLSALAHDARFLEVGLMGISQLGGVGASAMPSAPM